MKNNIETVTETTVELLPPSWRGVLPLMLAIWEQTDLPASVRADIMTEFGRMADLADAHCADVRATTPNIDTP
jgi:hypothetical protein